MIKNQYLDSNTVKQYLPDDPIKIDREFFWAFYLKVQPMKANSYITDVMKQHHDWEVKKAPNKQYLEVADDYIDELLKHDVKPSK